MNNICVLVRIINDLLDAKVRSRKFSPSRSIGEGSSSEGEHGTGRHVDIIRAVVFVVPEDADA